MRYASFSCYTYWLVSDLGNSRRIASIHVLDDDSLLHVFYLYRPFFSVDVDTCTFKGPSLKRWRSNARWWYTLAHVCRRWRNIILGSATYLDLFLLCTYGTPVAEMLAHSPPLPLIVRYSLKNSELTATDEEGSILALKQHGRVRRVRLSNAVTIMHTLFAVMDEEYPILEFLYISRRIRDSSKILRFPESFQAPHLRHLTLEGFALPTRSRLLTPAVGLVTLHLNMGNPSTYFHPNTLIRWISLMPQLETLKVRFESHTPNREVERQLMHTPIIAPITLPNLHCFHFRGVTAYLKTLVHRITAPRLKKLNIYFYSQLTLFSPHLLRFIAAAENLRSGEVSLSFSNKSASVGVHPNGLTEYSLVISVQCCHLDWQISSMTQILNSLSQMFSAAERLSLQHDVHSESSEEHNVVGRTVWRELLRPFGNVKTLQIRNGLVNDVSRCLKLEGGELPLELLPKLHKLVYYGSNNTCNVFTSFINARRNAGHPVTLVQL